MDRDKALALLRSVAAGEVTPATALDRLSLAPFADLAFAAVDHHGALRDGFPEVVYGPGKPPAQVARVAREIYARSRRLAVPRARPATGAARPTESPGAARASAGASSWKARPDTTRRCGAAWRSWV